MEYAILPETTLAAIIRDEAMNPAGGIERFLRATLPHVEAAVIVDTGSIDGTKDILSSLDKEYPHLGVFHREWDNFAQSRNYSLSKVKTKRVLVLDADELLTHEDYEVMVESIEEDMRVTYPVWGYDFAFRIIYPNGVQLINEYDMMNPRLFEVEGVEYEGNIYGGDEGLNLSLEIIMQAPVRIKHFLPSKEAKNRKYQNWYCKGEFLSVQPCAAALRDGWKEFNCGRNLFE
ncbi:hypothetical protein CEE44_04930 [Candidatus Woesearchaeota archaeon B3_Woes]|nr:MAG: hypothetical protein CEE44_04930 [Candidatus Woesearchaeota archaeon B3_Woes]